MRFSVKAALAAALLTAAPAMAASGSFFSGDGNKAAAPAASAPASPGDLAKAEDALAETWQRLPFATRNAMFVSRKAEVYGDYDKRPGSVFSPADKLMTYLEPTGYGYRDLGDGTVEFDLATDFELATSGGKILGGQKAMQQTKIRSHYRNRELMMNLTLTLDGIPPGDYVVAYVLHDNIAGKQARVEQPFKIGAPAP